MSDLKQQVDGYVAGMTAAAEKSRPVDAGSKLVQRVPDASVQGLAHGVLLFLGGEFTLADSDGKKFTLKISSDGVECFACGAHGQDPTEKAGA